MIGLSEHTGEIYAGIAAAGLGAEILEFHVVFDKRMFGPDAKSSLTIDQTTELVKGIRSIEKAMQNPIDKNDLSPYANLKSIFEKTLSANKDLPKGHILRFEDLEAKKPADMGVSAREYKSIIGKELTRDVSKWDFIQHSDIK